MTIELEGDTVQSVSFLGGCNGNLKGISALAKGQKAQDLIDTLSGLTCGFKNTSCPDQLAQALKAALAEA
ncbi:MAG: TIGR03905 family TSCPD domain-containing protein [Clostridia bacterium]|nr:TIGR03905 family TSCPD domain-containing protein [Clostridia bacterium]